MHQLAAATCSRNSYTFFLALASGISRRALFSIWKEEQTSFFKMNAILSFVRENTDFSQHDE